MKSYIGLFLFALILWIMPVGSDKETIEPVCKKCGEHCIYQIGERAGLNEYQTETLLIHFKIVK